MARVCVCLCKHARACSPTTRPPQTRPQHCPQHPPPPKNNPTQGNIEDILERFKTFKRSVPTRGAVLLDASLERVLLVRQYNGTSWGFPKGKINKNESDMEVCCVCAALRAVCVRARAVCSCARLAL